MTSDVEIRWMIRADLDDIRAIEAVSFDDPMTEAEWMAMLRDRNGITLVATIDDIICGYVAYRLSMSLGPGRGSLFIDHLAVDPDYRRQGVGTDMLCKLKRKLRQQGRNRLWALVPDSNLTAHLFFQANHFRGKVLDADTYGFEFFARQTAES